MIRAARLLPLLLLLAAVLVALSATSSSVPPREDAAVDAQPHHCGSSDLPREALVPIAASVRRVRDDGNGTAVYAAMARSSTSGYEPIRIGVFYEDLADSSRYCTRSGQIVPDFQGGTVTCTTADVLTDAKKDILMNKLVPDAVQLHADRLLVDPLSKVSAVPTYSGKICGSFTIPSAHHVNGVSDVDFVLYVASGPTTGTTVAWATVCSTLSGRYDSRPIVGVTNVSPKYIADDRQTIRTVGHEMLHSMGFMEDFFDAAGLTSTASVRGKTGVPVVTSSRVVSAAQDHYGCTSLKNMELEDGGGEGTAGSHWKRRNAKDEIMSGVVSFGYYTSLTIAVMEDLGYYKGDYSKAEIMPWGNNFGCSLISQKCLTNGKSIDSSMFCTADGGYTCTSAREAVGTCVSDGPAVSSWASSYGLWSDEDTMDYCPYVVPYSGLSCAESTLSYIPYSKFGTTSRCLDTDLSRPVCAAITCDTDTYQVQFETGSAVTCKPGSTVTVPGSRGVATCPPYIAVCEKECAGNCNPSGALGIAATGCWSVLLVLAAALLSLVA